MVTDAYDAQTGAVAAQADTATASIAAARGREHEAILLAADAERQRLHAARDAERQGATAHVEGLKQETLDAGEAEAQRALQSSEARAVAILAEVGAVDVAGDPPSAEAQRTSVRRIAQRAADQCRQTGSDLAERVRQEAAHHAATNYDGLLLAIRGPGLQRLDVQVLLAPSTGQIQACAAGAAASAAASAASRTRTEVIRRMTDRLR